MNVQPSLFDVPDELPTSAPYVRGSETSRAAADLILPTLAAKQIAVLRRLAAEPSTDNGLISYFVRYHEWSPNTPRARRVELVTARLVEASGGMKDGSTVWRVTAAGRELLLRLRED